jgi:hypothetical protein
MQIQQEESRPYYNFINSIRSKSSKLSYCGELRRYLRHYNIQSADQLLELPDEEPKIIRLHPTTERVQVKATNNKRFKEIL